MGKRESIFFPPPPPKPVVRWGEAPSEPPIMLCPDCGEALWQVTAPNGSDLALDRYQIETQQLPDGSVVRLEMPNRSPAVNKHVSAVGGYCSLTVEWFNGWSDDEPGWRWYASRMGLEDAEVHGIVIYSDHGLTCEAITEAQIIGKVTATGIEGDAAGDREGKRVWVLPPEMQADRATWLKLTAKHLKPREGGVKYAGQRALKAQIRRLSKRLSAVKPKRQRRPTPENLQLFAELEASQGGSLLQPATESVPLAEAESPRPDCGS